MKRFLPLIIVPFLGAIALVLMLVKLSHADTGSSSAGIGSAAIVTVDAGSGSGSGSAVTPADSIHDPVSHPAAAYDDLKAARREGWPAVFLLVILYAGRVLGRLGKAFPSVSFLAKLSEGRLAVIVAGVTTVAIAGYNAAMLGGSAMALVTALVGAAFLYWNSHPDPTKEIDPSKAAT